MNARLSKKIRQTMRRNWREFYADILALTFRQRLGVAWFILTHHKGKPKK